MKTTNPWVLDTLLLSLPMRGWTTLPEILKRVSPFGLASDPAKHGWWKLHRLFRWTERRRRVGADPGRADSGQSMPGAFPGRTSPMGAVWEYRLTAAGRAERRALEREIAREFGA